MVVHLKHKKLHGRPGKITNHYLVTPKFLRLVDIIIEETLSPALAGNMIRRQGNEGRHPGKHLYCLLIHLIYRK